MTWFPVVTPREYAERCSLALECTTPRMREKVTDIIARAIVDAVQTERERCAKVAEEEAVSRQSITGSLCARDIAARIRGGV
jgi:S-adenosylmethionine synthetase